MEPPDRPRWLQYALVGLFALALFGYAGWSGRPLTMHEARLPQTAREMRQTHHWLLPTSGIRPWLERPPLPHWIVAAAMTVTGHDDRVWVVRLPSAVMGTVTVLLTMWIAGRCFGRTVGILSGLALATSFEFYTYACQAEDDVYLAAFVAAAVALFVRGEMAAYGSPGEGVPLTLPVEHERFAGNRPWHVWALFLTAGLSNWVKGPLLGDAYIGSTLLAYLLCTGLVQRRWAGLHRLLWPWGILLALGLTVAWPAIAYHRHHDVLQNWRYDYFGWMNGDYSSETQPWWYYAPTLLGSLAPWTPLALVALMATARKTLQPGPASAALRLVWCWAIVPVLGLSVPHGKHHHYLVPIIAPWAILTAFGMVEAGRFFLVRRGPPWQRNPWVALGCLGLPGAAAIAWFHAGIPGPWFVTLALLLTWVAFVALLFVALDRGLGWLLLGTVLGGTVVCYCWGQTFVAAATDQTVDDTAFLLRVRRDVPAEVPLYIDAKLHPVGNLDFFRLQFYSRPDAVLLHNLSYLRDERITAAAVDVIARQCDEPLLRQLGTIAILDQSPRSHEMVVAKPKPEFFGRFTLYRLTFDPHLQRYPAPARVTTLQAMERAESSDPGPWCGPPLH